MSTPATAPMFDKIALIGIGLIGGSIALEARKRGLARTIVAATRSAETAATANRLKLTDHCGTDIEAAVKDADLVIVCTPVGACGPAAEVGCKRHQKSQHPTEHNFPVVVVPDERQEQWHQGNAQQQPCKGQPPPQR